VLVAGFEGEPRLAEIFHSMCCEILADHSGEIQADDFYLGCRLIRSPLPDAEHVDHLTATTGWSGAEVLARAVARVFGEGLATMRLSDFLHEGCAITWTARVDRTDAGDDPVAPVIARAAERIRSLGGTLTAHHGPFVVSPSPLLAGDSDFETFYEKLRATLDPSDILDPS
jgi:hypothetical protein